LEHALDIAIASTDLKETAVSIQSMTNTKTSDIDSTKRQIEELYAAGCSLIRVSTPTLKDVEFLGRIIDELSVISDKVKFIADVHYSVDVAIAAAPLVEKVRINPGNFLTREEMTWPDTARLKILSTKLRPLIAACKKYDTKIRIGVNHGSIYKSQSPKKNGRELVDSLMEYVNIFMDLKFYDLVLSIKSSDPWTMMDSNFILQEELKQRELALPVHLGVTEAGLGIQGLVKSALGIGSCLMAGIGDTIRVSLTEEPFEEIPVANAILEAVQKIEKNFTRDLFDQIECKAELSDHYQSPVLVHQLTGNYDIEKSNMWLGDYFLKNNQEKIKGLENVSSFKHFKQHYARERLFNVSYLLVEEDELKDVFAFFRNECIDLPILVKTFFNENNLSGICSSSIILPRLIREGLVHGLWLESDSLEKMKFQAEVAAEILQVSGRREINTRIIACPGCSRSNFNLQSITKELKESFSEEKITISIMGCSVNGYGEMMKSDFGIIGSASGKVDIYKNRQLIKAAVAEDELHLIISNNL